MVLLQVGDWLVQMKMLELELEPELLVPRQVLGQILRLQGSPPLVSCQSPRTQRQDPLQGRERRRGRGAALHHLLLQLRSHATS